MNITGTGDVVIFPDFRGPRGPRGRTGISAYEQAVLDGFEGTIEQWLTSLNPTTVVFDQSVAATVWTVQHNLGRFPSVTVIVGGDEVEADIVYVDNDLLTVTFTVAVAGTLYLN